jgi:hypothetical protein
MRKPATGMKPAESGLTSFMEGAAPRLLIIVDGCDNAAVG